MLKRVKITAEKEIHRGVYVSVVQTGKSNERKYVYAARRSRKSLMRLIYRTDRDDQISKIFLITLMCV